MLGARGLKITWGSSPEYWEWKSIHGSRFPEVAILLMVWWFEIICKFETKMLSPNTAYSAFFVFKPRGDYGFESLPINVSFNFIDELGDDEMGHAMMMMNTVYLKRTLTEPMLDRNCKISQMRDGGWFEVELGEFFVNTGENRQVEIRIFEVEEGGPKCGLVVEGIELRPKVIA